MQKEEWRIGVMRFCGSSLIAAGALAALANVVWTPRLPYSEGTVAVASSSAFFARMGLASASVALLALGVIGLYLAHADRLRLGAFTFLLAGFGCVLTFWLEFVQFTLIRDLATTIPQVFARIEGDGSLTAYDRAFAVSAGVFALGWIAMSIVILRQGLLPWRGPAAFLSGLVLVPVLGATMPGLWGAVAGNVIVALGWVLLGVDLRAVAEPSQVPSATYRR